MKKRGLSLLLAIIMVATVFSPAMGIIASAAAGDTVELAFSNIFVLEEWANNSISSTVIVGGVPQDKENDGLEVDLENGSFTLTKKVADGDELYTAFAMDLTNAVGNNQYYMMDIEPNTNYTFSYNVEGNIHVFTPYVFFYDEMGYWINGGMVAYPTPGYGYNAFSFTTPAGAEKMQLRWTIGDNSTAGNSSASTVTATVKDIAIFETELENRYRNTCNMFDFDSWANNAYSSAASQLSPGNGTVKKDVSNRTITITCTSGNFWTGFGIDANTSNDHYYTMAVDPTKTYTLSYDVTDISLPGAVHCQPWIAEFDSSGKYITHYQNDQNLRFGSNKWQFTCRGANTARIQIAFSVVGVPAEASCIVSNIGVYETSFEAIAGHVHRKAYKEGAGTYGTLPTPTNIPLGMVFAGWYTGKDGSGEHITEDTEISYKSLTVYPYYQAKVDSLSIKTLPTKTAYTLGEKINPAGLVLTGTQTYTVDVLDDKGNVTGTETKTNTFNITSGYTIKPEYVKSTGTQAITVSYGGKTTTFNVNVKEYDEKSILVNGSNVVAKVANNVYTLNYTAPEAFSRYELTYYSDSYVKGTITMSNGTYEDFFLEPSTKGSFASYIDDYLTGGTYADVKSISFECLNKEFGSFELYSVDTIYVEKPADTMAYYENNEYKAGINLAWGGVLAYLQDYKHNPVAATYSDGITKVNYSSQLPAGSTAQSNAVNLINTFDKGRYVQQSYYGTSEEPYVMGNYNGVDWNYNPVQGGNLIGEASKVVDYRITDTEIYVKTRPLEWAKWSDKGAEEYNKIQADDSLDKELIYEDSYNAWAYMEAWYVFEDGMLKTYCRFVDYSGYPSAVTTQEFPAFYCVEPLNHFVYYSGGDAWGSTNTATWESDLDFWGASPEYNAMLVKNGHEAVDPYYECNENWAAFMGGNSNNDYGIGIYTEGVTDFVAGSYHTKYQDGQTTLIPQITSLRHADTTDPATEDPTSYISPIDTMEFNSYQEYTYSYYITTGTQAQIREDFRTAREKDETEALSGTKIAVPETVYMQPVGSPTATTTMGQYYVNNVLDANNYFNVKTVANSADGMYFGLYSLGAEKYTISVTNATNPSNDIILGNANGTGNVEGTEHTVGATGNDIHDEEYSLRFQSTGLKPGEIATAKWEITVKYKDGTTKTHTAYTVLYAPELTVGAVAESRKEDISETEISSWITGVNGVNHSQNSPLSATHGDKKAAGYFKYDPLVNEDPPSPTIGSGETPDDYIYAVLGTVDVDAGIANDGNYVMQTATNGHDSSRAKSYLGLLTVDKSRYTNTNQIPNLEIGYDLLRVGSRPDRSLASYYTFYTLGTAESFTGTDKRDRPTGWTEPGTTVSKGTSAPVRERYVPSFDVSTIDGKYIHALNQSRSVYIADAQEYISYLNEYATACTSVLCSVTDKSGLRDSVLEGYSISKDNYTDSLYNKMLEELEDAATVLGDPSATQEEIDNAQKDLDDVLAEFAVFYTLKYDNIFSAYEFSQKLFNMTASEPDYTTVDYENGVITIENSAMSAGETYTKYSSSNDCYKVTLQPDTEYVFEYDVTTTLKAQAFMFFYNSDGGLSEAPKNMSVKTNNGAWEPRTETNSWWGNYTDSAGTYHYAIKFTTGPNTTQASFRFGNTSNSAVTSDFSNIKLITSDKYYEGATYSATEAVYEEYDSYGAMATVTRPGYTFTGWKDEGGKTVTGATLATKNLSVYSQWNENSYTIRYNANGGTGTIADETVKYTENVALPTGGVTNYANNLALKGWATTPGATEPTYLPGQTVSKLTGEADGVVTLYAVWYAPGKINVTFDNLVDISKWSTSVGSGNRVNPTETGFTIKSDVGVGEATCSSAYFKVVAGHKYVLESDIKGDGWDIYFFFCDANGNWVDFNDDASDRMSSNKTGSAFEVNGTKYTSAEFTAPAGAVKAQLRVDANGSNNAVRFENIRVYDVTNKTYLNTVNKYVEYGDAYGELPVPVKDGSQFLGWFDTNGNEVTAESIMNSTSTVYLTSKWTVNPYTANDDTVVIEYGCPVTINVRANDKDGTVSGIGTKGVSGSNIGGTSYPSSILTDKANTLTLAAGTVTLNADGTITFTPTNTNVTEEIVFYYELTVDDDYYYAKVTIIPATTLYFEDTFFTFAGSTVTKNGTTINYNWQTIGTPVDGVTQSADRPGAFNFYDDANNVYGYDPKSDGQVSYSGGSVHFVQVDQFAGATTPTATFTFTGTGFDLFSVTDSKSGTVTVTIYRGTEVDAENREMGIMSNTYFGYKYENGSYVTTNNGALLQVPIIRARDLSYGTYTVVVQPRYNRTLDVAKTGKSGVYVDSVRIYDPMGDNKVANDAYMSDGEYAPQYLEIRDTLVSSNKDGSFTVSDLGIGKSVFLDGGKTSMDDFANLGPKNEVYLQNGNSVAFHIVTDRADLPSTVQLGMKLTGKGGNTATVKLMNSDYNGWSENITLNSTEERYYNIEAVVDWVKQDDGTYKTASPIIVTNTSDAIISLTSLKWAFDSATNTATVLSVMSDMDTPELAKAAIMRMSNPQVTPQQTILNKDNISYAFASESYAPGDVGTLTITTEQGVSGVTVNGTDVLDCVTNADGKLEWTFEFTAESAESMTFEIIARDEDGFTSEAIYATIAIENDVADDGENDATEPDDGTSDDTTVDSGSGLGDISFATNLVTKILALIMKVFGLLLGGVTA